MSRKTIFLFLPCCCFFSGVLLPSVSFTSNSNFSFKIVWPASVHQPLLRGEMYIEQGLRLKCVFTSMIAFSHFSFNVVPWYTTVSKKIVLVSDISAVNFKASRAVG